VYALYAARAPLWRSMRPRGLLMALLLAVALFMVYVALAIQHPTLQAPQFRAAESAAGALPWLFLILTSGALAGFQLLIIYGITGRQLRHETDARYLGYGGALAEGVVALSAILIGATAAADSNTWALQYLALPSAAEFPRAATLYIDGYARLLGALGIDVASARNLAATVLAGMALAGTEAGTRALKQLLGPAAAPTPSPARRYEGRGRLWVIVALAAAIALGDGRGLGGLLLWPVLALAGLWIACAGLAATALALRALQRGAALLWALVLGVGAIAAWASVAQLTEWLQAGAWGRSILGGVVVLAALALLGSGAHRYRGATDPTTARPPA
jgi:carbon starvation protein